MHAHDIIRLRHMLEAAEEAMSFARGLTRADLDGDRRTVLAIVKSVENIGEAASKVSADCRRGLPEIPWPAIVAMRNRLVHVYFAVNLDRVWETITDDLPRLIAEFEKALPSEDENE